MRVYTFTTRNRGASLLVGLLVLGGGVALLLLGLALLAGVALVGGVLGTGIIAYRMLRGKSSQPLSRPTATAELDPSLEVVAPPESPDGARMIEPNANSAGRDRRVDG
jgi:hypothetical protein